MRTGHTRNYAVGCGSSSNPVDRINHKSCIKCAIYLSHSSLTLSRSLENLINNRPKNQYMTLLPTHAQFFSLLSSQPLNLFNVDSLLHASHFAQLKICVCTYVYKYCTINTNKRWLDWLADHFNQLVCNVELQWVSIYYSIYVCGNSYSFIDWMESKRESDSGLLPINKPTLNIDILLWFCRFCSGSCHNDDACTFLTIFITQRCRRCCCFYSLFQFFYATQLALL